MSPALPKVVITGPIPQPAVDLLAAAADVWMNTDDLLSRAELLERVAGADAVVSLLTAMVDGELLAAAGPQLKVVANVAVGYNNIDVAACRAAGVVATNTPGVLTDATADIAMALLLMATRRLGSAERAVRSGMPWKWGMFEFLGVGVQGARLGIVGMGQIGTALARRARAHGMTIAYTNRSEADAPVVSELSATRLPVDELLATSDVVSLHCPYGPQTHHLVDTAALAKMKPTAYLINTARGSVVDEAALVVALRTGVIAGAGLDVYEREPELHAGLLDLDNVVLLPHVGSATIETRTAMATLAARNALAVLAGGSAITPIG
jgi:glyoxylate reductase